jgi:hypothetical protein
MTQSISEKLISMLQTLEFYASEDFSNETKQRAYGEVADGLSKIRLAKIRGGNVSDYHLSLFDAVRLRHDELTFGLTR